MQAPAVDRDHRHAELAGERAQRQSGEDLSVVPPDRTVLEEHARVHDTAVQPQVLQRRHAVDLHQEPGADRPNFGRPLDHPYVEALPEQSDGERQPADAPTGNEDGSRVLHL